MLDGFSAEQEERVLKRQKAQAKRVIKKGIDVEEIFSAKEARQTKLSHDTAINRDQKRLKLHISHVKRQLNALRYNLKNWDHEEETAKREAQIAEERRLLEIEMRGPLSRKEIADHKRFIKYDPSNWKLRGAARPAWEVYDFDTRYVCPHLKAFRDADSKAKRVQNLLHQHRGHFLESHTNADASNVNCPPQPQCTSFLALLYQYGMLNMEAKRFKSATEAWRECVTLEGTGAGTSGGSTDTTAITPKHDSDEEEKKDDSIMDNNMDDDESVPDLVSLAKHTTTTTTQYTPARCRLMRLFLEHNKPEEARQLYEELNPNAGVTVNGNNTNNNTNNNNNQKLSAWIQYGQLLVEYVSWKLLNEPGSSEAKTLVQLRRAMAMTSNHGGGNSNTNNNSNGNVYCAYRIAYADVFEQFVEYADEIEDAASGTLLEAIEYGASEQMVIWQETEGAMDWLKETLERIYAQASIKAPLEVEVEHDGDSSSKNKNKSTKTITMTLTRADIAWEQSLAKDEQDYKQHSLLLLQQRQQQDEEDAQNNDKEEQEPQSQPPLTTTTNDAAKDEEEQGADEEVEENDVPQVDFPMYCNMFRSAMDAVHDAT
jgi:hypothetical protein